MQTKSIFQNAETPLIFVKSGTESAQIPEILRLSVRPVVIGRGIPYRSLNNANSAGRSWKFHRRIGIGRENFSTCKFHEMGSYWSICGVKFPLFQSGNLVRTGPCRWIFRENYYSGPKAKIFLKALIHRSNFITMYQIVRKMFSKIPFLPISLASVGWLLFTDLFEFLDTNN